MGQHMEIIHGILPACQIIDRKVREAREGYREQMDGLNDVRKGTSHRIIDKKDRA